MQTLPRTQKLFRCALAVGVSLATLPLAGCAARRPVSPAQPAMSAEQVQRNPNLSPAEKARAQFYLQQGPHAGAAPSPTSK